MFTVNPFTNFKFPSGPFTIDKINGIWPGFSRLIPEDKGLIVDIVNTWRRISQY